jgi:hypothetical protein
MSQEGAAESGQGEQGLRLSKSAPLARALVETIHAGEVESLTELLTEHPGLASARIADDKGGSGTPLHMAADWPVERGARVDRLWHAAALGMMTRAEELLAASPPARQQLTDAFWQACHGGERRMAEYLLALGADLNGTP